MSDWLGNRDVLSASRKERQRSTVFISGYVVSKLDRFVEASAFVNKEPVSENWIRIGLFVSTALLSLITIVTNRVYFRPDPPEEDSKSAKDVARTRWAKAVHSPRRFSHRRNEQPIPEPKLSDITATQAREPG